MIHHIGWRTACGGFIAACLLGATPSGQEPPDFKVLYAQAEYDRALTLLGSLQTVEAYEYKALCLLALGRTQDADAAVRSLVTMAPTFVPSTEEAPPRFVELVMTTRKALLPALAKRAFAEGRERFAEKRNDDAIERFNLVLTLTSDPVFDDAASAQDLKTLAQGFIDLARAAAPPPKPVPAPAPAEPPPTPLQLPKVVQPVAVVQTVPPVPPELLGRMGARLSILVQISPEGRVTSATVQQSAQPKYDQMVVQATREWRYKPATVNGVPISSEQVVAIQPMR